MKQVYDDGGRSEAGFKGSTGDCVTRSIAIVTGLSYQKVYNDLNELAKPFNDKRVKKGRKTSSARTGVHRQVYDRYLKELGMKWIPTMQIGSGCKVHLVDGELPSGRIICRLSKHLTAVIDGVIHDIFDPQRTIGWVNVKDGIETSGTSYRCVYGYYIF